MAPSASTQVLLSPAELSYLHTSLSSSPPLRPDLRGPAQFRPLTAENDVLAGTNGSARICFADGTEAIVGIKAEVESTSLSQTGSTISNWIEISTEIPGLRDNDPMPVYLSEMLHEGLVSEDLTRRLSVNSRFHWKLYIDVLLLSPPLSYPLPLLSLTTHLALLSTRLPRLKSEADEDPLFDDDWEASERLYTKDRPPITLLVMAVGSNVIFDPSREELAVAECVFAVTVGEILAVRTIDPPSRLTPPGISDSATTEGIWSPPKGGVKRALVSNMIQSVKGGLVENILASLANV